MARLFAIVLGLAFGGLASAQCPPWYPQYPVAPSYPWTPAIWGAPAPPPLPPAPPPFVPKAIPSIREEDEPVLPKPADKSKNGTKGTTDEKDKDTPRVPKTRIPIPGDPLDKTVPDVPKSDTPKSDSPKKDSPPGKSVEQYVVPAEGRGEPQAQVKVGFFNHSDRDLVLEVNGDPVRLPKDQYVTIRLPRTFQWSEKGGKSTDVVVPPDADGIEIVFRK